MSGAGEGKREGGDRERGERGEGRREAASDQGGGKAASHGEVESLDRRVVG